MTSAPDWLVNVFLYTFLFGLIFTIVSLVLGVTDAGGLGSGGGDVDVDLDLDLDLDGGDAGSADAPGSEGPGVFNMPTIMAFITWLGGAGYIFTKSLGLGSFLAVPLAVLSGILGGSIMFFIITRLLWPMMAKPLNRADFQLPGTPARVVSSIRTGGVGEIVYSKAGSRFTAGARNVDEQPIAKGAEVVIVKYERGVAYVQPIESILGTRGGEVKPA